MPRLLGILGLVLTLALTLQPGPAAAQEPTWRAGVATVKITPEEPVRMAGYGGRNEPSQGVNLDLFAKALVLEDAEGRRGLLITTDLIGFRAKFGDDVCAQIRDKVGLERSQILLNSSHTHTGPVVDADEGRLYGLSPEQAERTAAFSKSLQQKLVKLAEEAIANLAPARLSWGAGVANFVMNRREYTPAGVKLGVNARGLADRSVPVLRIDSADGKLRAAVFGAACHNTTLGPKDLRISGDYAGYAQGVIERAQPGAVALFVLGCGGDANPYPRGSEELARLHGQALGDEVLRVLGSKLTPIAGQKLTTELDYVELPLHTQFTVADLERIAAEAGSRQSNARQLLELAKQRQPLPASYRAPQAAWQIGDLTLVALSGEVVVDYVPLLEKALGQQRLWIAAYSNDVFGYVPSARVVEEGGYETRGLIHGGAGFFSPQVQDVLVAKIKALAEKAGRKLETR